jgi:hypothetical protein
MLIFFGCLLTVASILAVPNLFVSKKNDLANFFKKVIPYQGWLGLIVCIIGAVGLVQYALQITTKMEGVLLVLILLWLTGMLCSAMLTFLGFLLSYNVIYTYFLAKKEKAEDNLKKMRTNIMPMQGKIGLLGILIGVWSIMAAVMFA